MISVVIPAYNRVELLPITLRSLLRQSVPAHEILVVDDGSTDGTAEVAARFGAPVRVIRQENAGPAAARNRGYHESTGEFIHFFDSDDLALKNKHEVQLNTLQRSGADIALGPWVKGSICEMGFEAENQVLQQNGLPGNDLVKSLLTSWSVIPHACLFRREIINDVGGFPEDLFVGEDQLMFLRCLLSGARVVHSPGTLTLYRTNNEEKITGVAGPARAKHHRAWARFLLKAASECVAHGIDPTRWYQFRGRAWQAAQDLGSSDSSNAGLVSELSAISGGPLWDPVYWCSRAIQRRKDGLQQRVVGSRGSRAFRMGPLTSAQRQGIEEIFRAG